MNTSLAQRSLLGPALFTVTFLGVELCGIAWGQVAPDHVLGFQMFNESSRMRIELFREIERKGKRVLVPAPGGEWRAPDRQGKTHRYSWHDRVRYYPLRELERDVPASYGLAAQLFRLQAALDDMARHIEGDTKTQALVAVVAASHTGRPQTHRLRAERP